MRAAVVLCALAGCAGSPVGALRFRNQPAVWQLDDRRDVQRPAKRPFDNLLYYFDAFAAERTATLLSLPVAPHAADVNALDEVADSTWFTNRIGRRAVSPDEIRGAAAAGAPPAGPWAVLGSKLGGSEPGLLVADAHGAHYLMKFDAPGAAEMETGADVVVQKLVWSLGYNTPDDRIAVVGRDELGLAPGATFDDGVATRAMTVQDLDAVLARVDRRPDGGYRTVVSRYLAGAPLGGYPRAGVRGDDPNDRIPHEDRRSLRAQAVIFAWLDHTDINESNSLDMWVGDAGHRHVRHYLVDFGKALGVYGWGEVVPSDGYAQSLDLRYGALSLAALGLWTRPWEGADGARLRGVGRFEAEHFDPLDWTDRYPYTPFTRLDDADGFWAAKLIMQFTTEQLRAAVDQGQYSDPRAADYLVRTLAARQRKIARAWFDRVSPLDRFHTTGDALCFDDLLRSELGDARHTRYVARSFEFSGAPTGWAASSDGAASACIAGIRPGADHDGYVIVELTAIREGEALPPVRVHLALDSVSGAQRLRIIGIRRI